MYAVPAPALHAFWQALRRLLQAQLPSEAANILPTQLTAPHDYLAHWREPKLLLSQSCGFPLVNHLHDTVQVLGTFAYDVHGAQGILCASQLVCRTDDARNGLAAFQGSVLAYNETGSQSGYHALRGAVGSLTNASPEAFFARTFATGAHVASIQAVLAGQADMASIDAVTLALWQAAHPQEAQGLRVLGHSAYYPGLPLITVAGTSASTVSALQDALEHVATNAAFATVRAPLRICGFARTTRADYAVCRADVDGLGAL